MQMQKRHSVNSGTVKLVNQKFELYGACVLEEYSTESRGSANVSEVSTEVLQVFQKKFQRITIPILLQVSNILQTK